jgi:hypothetical protein
MKLKMKNESRTSRMKSVGVLGNISGLGASIMSMDYDSDDDQAYCDCPEAKYFLDLQTGNGCLRGNSNSDICNKFIENLITVYKICVDKQKNKADRDACEVSIVGIRNTY